MSTQGTSVVRPWIDGEWLDSDEDADSVNPATGEVIGSHAMAGPHN
jgi:acyl-CoA reductase-like NAD-dependent aldehyde dehydrogenase